MPTDKSKIVIYQSKNKDVILNVAIEKETVWLTQAQMTKLFGRDRTVITKHVNNIFQESELVEKSNVQNLHIANSNKPVKAYSLDVIISVGYRVKFHEGTHFRQWATKVLREHVLKGYNFNRDRIKTNYQHFLKTVEDVKSLLLPDITVDNESAYAS